jgi:hypothetical protein
MLDLVAGSIIKGWPTLYDDRGMMNSLTSKRIILPGTIRPRLGLSIYVIAGRICLISACLAEALATCV